LRRKDLDITTKSAITPTYLLPLFYIIFQHVYFMSWDTSWPSSCEKLIPCTPHLVPG